MATKKHSTISDIPHSDELSLRLTVAQARFEALEELQRSGRQVGKELEEARLELADAAERVAQEGLRQAERAKGSKLTEEQRQDAARLKAIYEARKAEDKSLTQESLAAACGWKTQSAVTQYLNAIVPLNLDALIKFSLALKAPITEISPTLSQKILAVRLFDDVEAKPRETITHQGWVIGKAFDRLEKPAQKSAVIAQLEAFGVLDPASLIPPSDE